MKVGGTLTVPGDKSISHRALILAALGAGESRLTGLLRSADVRSTAGALRAMGVAIPELGDEVAIQGLGRRGLRAPDDALDCGNSGTSARLLAGVVAGHPFAARFVGDASLSRRPMRRVARPLQHMGARVELSPAGTLPMTVEGAELGAIDWDTGTPSAQVKSAILLAALVAGSSATVRESSLSRDHTERMLVALGVPLVRQDTVVFIRRVASLPGLDLAVPADPSSAAFFAALAALATGGELAMPNVCVNPTRTGFLRALARMGAAVRTADEVERAGEPVATVVAGPGTLRGVSVGEGEVPSMIDELPMLACVAARAEGETVITGAGELRVKESDRIAAVVANLRAIGADAHELPDGMRIAGSDRPLRGAVRTFGDHRIAMAFGVLGALPGNAIDIDDRACVDVSFPGFWEKLDAVVER